MADATFRRTDSPSPRYAEVLAGYSTRDMVCYDCDLGSEYAVAYLGADGYGFMLHFVGGRVDPEEYGLEPGDIDCGADTFTVRTRLTFY